MYPWLLLVERAAPGAGDAGGPRHRYISERSFASWQNCGPRSCPSFRGQPRPGSQGAYPCAGFLSTVDADGTLPLQRRASLQSEDLFCDQDDQGRGGQPTKDAVDLARMVAEPCRKRMCRDQNDIPRLKRGHVLDGRKATA